MNHRDLAIILLRLSAIWFVGFGLAAFGHAILQMLSLSGLRIGPENNAFNGYALIWLLSPLIEIAVGVVLWSFAPWLSSRVIPAERRS